MHIYTIKKLLNIPEYKVTEIISKDENNELIELINCKQRFILLKAKHKLTERQADYLDRLCKINEPIYKAMLLRESFLKIYDYNDPEGAKEYLIGWIKDAISSTLEIFKA